jgi:hypothetical protein
MRWLTALLAVVVMVVAVPAAHASELVWIGGEYEYRAAPGETNVLDIYTQGTTITIRDSGATMTVSVPFCTLADAHTATCQITTLGGSGPIPSHISALLSDGDDTAVAVGNPMLITLHGEDGNDTLTVGGPATPLNGLVDAFGDAGDDRLSGGAGSEFLHGGDGADSLAGGDNFDLLDGGDGPDVLLGGAGADRLDGWSGDDRLDGGLDRDRAAGHDGDDVVLLDGTDVANGGKGDDSLVATGGGTATIGCSAGRDRVAPSWGDLVAVSCERIEQTVTCGAGRACRVAAVLATAAGRVLATATKRIPAGGSRTLGLALARKARDEIRRRKQMALTLRIKALAGNVTGRKRSRLTIRALEPIP